MKRRNSSSRLRLGAATTLGAKARPMHPDLLAYAAADVVHLHAMWKEWKHFMGRGKMDDTVAKRIKRHAKAMDARTAGGKQNAGSRRDF